MKYTSIRVSRSADNIFEAYINFKNKGKSGKEKITKTALFERYAFTLMKSIPDSFLSENTKN